MVYLGITLTSKVSHLVRENYIPFLSSLRPKLDKLRRFELSWTGRLAAFKMQVLPQFLYIFRTLPIPVPQSFFQQAQSAIDRYLWSGKKARCAFNKLIKLKQMGGIGHRSYLDKRLPGGYHTSPNERLVPSPQQHPMDRTRELPNQRRKSI